MSDIEVKQPVDSAQATMQDLENANLRDTVSQLQAESVFKNRQLESVGELTVLLAVVHGLVLKSGNVVGQLTEVTNDLLFRQLAEVTNLEERATHDPLLTKLLNRPGFQQRYQSAQEQSRRETDQLKSCHSVVFLDIDDFKKFNLSLGHTKTDMQVLEVFADLIGQNIRQDEGDFAARFGGEEFVLFLNGTNAETADAIIDRVRELCGQIIFEEDKSLTLGFSAGICEITADTSFDHAVGWADLAEGRAKQLPNKNQTVVWTPDL